MNSRTFLLSSTRIEQLYPINSSWPTGSIDKVLQPIIQLLIWITSLLWFAIDDLKDAICRVVLHLGWVLVLLWITVWVLVTTFSYVEIVFFWIIWVILIWLGGRLYRVMIFIWQRLRTLGSWAWVHAPRFATWIVHEFGNPMICLICIILGVMSANLLPTALLLKLSSTLWINVSIPPLAVLVISARVFDTRAYRRWQGAAKGRLGVRMLRAYSDGIMWPVLFRRC